MPPMFEQMIVRDNMKSANELDEKSLDYYEATRQDINGRMRRVEREFGKLGIPSITFEGTYYLLIDVERLRKKIDEKYMRDLNTGEIMSNQLDKAFCRMMYLEKQIGMFPLSALYFGENIPDNFVRIALNRNDEDIQYLVDAFKTWFIKFD